MPLSYYRLLKIFSPLIFLYQWGVFLRRFFVKGKLPPLPVISVGNIAFGGTGKTPVTVYLARIFSARGKKIGVGIRGYGGRLRLKSYPPYQGIDPREAGDEAAVLRENLPWAWIFVGKKREELAREAKKRGLDLLLLDDGFQYLSLKKIEVVLHSEKIQKFYLREAKKALDFAHILLVPPEESLEGAFHYRLFPSEVPQEEVFVFCGIGRPERFLALFPKVKDKLVFPDHHPYSSKDLEEIYARSKGLPIYTTEKDLVKVRRLSNFRGRISAVKWLAEVEEGALLALEEFLKSWPSVLK